MSRRIDICPTCKGKGEIIVDNWLTEGMTEEEIAKEKEKALADIVEVVRCKDCVHWGGTTYGFICRKFSGLDTKICMGADHYCSYGERRDENEG